MSPAGRRQIPRTRLAHLLIALALVGCTDPGSVTAPTDSTGSLDLSLLGPEAQRRELATAAFALRRNESRLARQPGLVAAAVGLTAAGRPAIRLYVDGPTLDDMPDEVDGFPVVRVRSGRVGALGLGPRDGPGSDAPRSLDFDTASRHRPAPSGVSIGHPAETSGTLGALVRRGGTTYILSNNHVIARLGKARIGEPVLQPGTIDGGTAADRIASLSAFRPIVLHPTARNIADAAIAEVSLIDAPVVTGLTPSYGKPRSRIIEASVGMRVMKYGRTTGHTTGVVEGVNAIVYVGYDEGTARFVDQIVIRGAGFSAGGDSGSLVVVETGWPSRRPLGLLYGGSDDISVASPIGPVLEGFGATIVGN
ncbi:MAG: hypothetical protein R3195_15825 [Gemmatimonadota bacterium]|nr:hypothetical protein [Gemmatimonadota bacterium]